MLGRLSTRLFCSDVPRSAKRTLAGRNLKMGPYAGGRLLPSFSEDPQEYIVCFIIVAVTFYGIMNLSSGESYPEGRRRLIRERIRQEYNLPEGWDDEIEGESPALSSVVSK